MVPITDEAEHQGTRHHGVTMTPEHGFYMAPWGPGGWDSACHQRGAFIWIGGSDLW